MAWKAVGILFLALLAPCGAAAEAAQKSAVDEAQILYDQGVALEKAGKADDAVASFQAALATDPDFSEADLELGRIYTKLGWRGKALESLHRYLDSGAVDPQAKQLYESLVRQGDALGMFEEEGPEFLASEGPLSLEAGLGYGWGFNQSNFGRRFNSDGNANSFSYPYNVGEGVSYSFEAVYDFSPNLGLGLALSPLGTDTTSGESISYQGLSPTTISDRTTAKEQAYPLLVNLHVRSRMGKNLRWSAFFGAGMVFSGPYTETSSDQQSGSGGNLNTSVSYQRNLNAGLALNGGFGLEFLLSPHWTLFLKSSLMVAQVGAASATYSSATYNSAGKLVGSSSVTNSYGANPSKSQSVDPVSTTVAGPFPAGVSAETVTTYDNGPTQYKETVQTSSTGQVVSDVFSETNQYSQSADTITFKVLAATAGLRWEF